MSVKLRKNEVARLTDFEEKLADLEEPQGPCFYYESPGRRGNLDAYRNLYPYVS